MWLLRGHLPLLVSVINGSVLVISLFLSELLIGAALISDA
jgi:hypothetical protein